MSEKVKKKAVDVQQFVPKKQVYNGCANDAALFLQRDQLSDVVLWKRFVQQYRDQIDGTNQGWRGEYWGKLMRGAAMVCEYTQDQELYDTLTDTVRDMMTVAEEDGRVSTYTRDTEFDAWDLWSRKYVLLGMEYYYDICRDEALKAEIVRFLSRCADYIVAHIGNGEGQKPITKATRSWLGINSSSILEPMVWLYRLTADQKYFDFSTYIVESGAADGVNIFELAYENKLYPYQYGIGEYGVAKAYEMISCFEGLIEYYRITGIEKYKTAAVNFGKAVIDSDVTVIGTCGCTHELFDHSKNRQTAYYEGIMQETCVTVTWMKYCSQLLRLTGERVFADQIEQAFYNAYLGSLNVEHRVCPFISKRFLEYVNDPSELKHTFLPFDSYSPLIPGKRGQKVGGEQLMADKSYYGCCVCIAPAGVGLFLGHAVMQDAKGLTVNFFENGSSVIDLDGNTVTIKTETAYPADGVIKMTVAVDEPVKMRLRVRLPEWSKDTVIASRKFRVVENGYAIFEGEWSGEETLTVELDMRIRETLPITWDTDYIYTDMSRKKPGLTHVGFGMEVKHKPEEDDYISLSRGPLVLGVDSRMGKDAFSAFSFKREGGEIVYRVCEEKEIVSGTPCMLNCEFTSESGEVFHLVDYASAGRDWQTNIAAWLPTVEK